MLKYIFSVLMGLCSLTGFGQSIASLNFRHLYDPQNEIDFSMKLVNEKNQLIVYYRLQRSGQQVNDTYSITWQKYETYTQRGGTTMASGDSIATSGRLYYPIPEKPWILLAKITNKSTGHTWNYNVILMYMIF